MPSLYPELTNTLQAVLPVTDVLDRPLYPSMQSLVQQMAPPIFGNQFSPIKPDVPPVQAPADLENIINEASAQYDIPPNLLKAVIKQESGFKPGVVSHRGAAGYMQLMPSTAKDLGVKDVWDARQNIMGGAKYLRQQWDRFGSPELALAAYNAGPGHVLQYGRTIPPFRETQNYVRNIMNMWGYR